MNNQITKYKFFSMYETETAADVLPTFHKSLV